MFHAKNNVMQGVSPCKPWECSRVHLPANVWGTAGKPARVEWMTNPATESCFYSVWEGQNDAQRVRQGGEGGSEAENLPQFLHGVVADIDMDFSDDQITAEIEKLNFKPTWLSKTLSDHWHLVFLFDKKVGVPPVWDTASKLAHEILKRVGADKISQIDKGSWLPSQRFCNSGRWVRYTNDDGTPVLPLQSSVVIGWAASKLQKLQCFEATEENKMPIDLVYEELKKRPDFAWDGEFKEGAQGPSFWIVGSTSPKSAMVKAGGMFTFAAHASKQFWPWSELVSKEFVAQHTAGRIGQILEKIFYDGRAYYQQDFSQIWRPCQTEDLTRDLRVMGIHSWTEKGSTHSEMDDLISKIRKMNHIDGASPYAFRPHGIIEINQQRKLNTFNRKLCPMHPHPVKWGEGFSRQIAPLTEWLFDEEQIARILSWLHWAYKGYSLNRPETGQALIIVGDPGVGKSCWINEVVGELLGGSADASIYLQGDDPFGGELYSVACWTFEDTALGTDPKARERMARRIKQFVANIRHRSHRKYMDPDYNEWAGRLIGSMNGDTQSLQQAVPLDASILDKLIYLHTRAKKIFPFLGRHESSEIFKEERPYFARYVHDYVIPERMRGSKRYGVKEHIDASLLPLLKNASTTAGLAQALDQWAREYFTDNPAETHWKGTTLELSLALSQNTLLKDVLKIDVAALSRSLPELLPHLEFLDLTHEGTRELWVLTPPEGMDRSPKKHNPKVATAS